MRRVHDIVARLEGEGHVGHVDAPRAPTPGGARGEVGDGEHGEACRGHDDACRYLGVHEGDHAARERLVLPLALVVRERLREGYVLVREVQLEVLAGRPVGHAEDGHGVVAHELATPAEHTRVGARDVGLLDGQTGACPLARALEGGEGEALLGAEVKLLGQGVESLDARACHRGGMGDVVLGMHAVVEERAWLAQDQKRLLRDVLDGRGGHAAIELG